MARKKMTKQEKVWKYLIKNPLASTKDIAEKVGCTPKYVYSLRSKTGTPKEILAKDIKPLMPPRTKVLTQADKLVNGARAAEYGDAKQNFEDIAKLWSVLLETEVTAQQVALCMIAVKSARLMKSASHDSWVDICGYGALGGELHEKV